MALAVLVVEKDVRRRVCSRGWWDDGFLPETTAPETEEVVVVVAV
jgi:hypothetical protein